MSNTSYYYTDFQSPDYTPITPGLNEGGPTHEEASHLNDASNEKKTRNLNQIQSNGSELLPNNKAVAPVKNPTAISWYENEKAVHRLCLSNPRDVVILVLSLIIVVIVLIAAIAIGILGASTYVLGFAFFHLFML